MEKPLHIRNLDSGFRQGGEKAFLKRWNQKHQKTTAQQGHWMGHWRQLWSARGVGERILLSGSLWFKSCQTLLGKGICLFASLLRDCLCWPQPTPTPTIYPFLAHQSPSHSRSEMNTIFILQSGMQPAPRGVRHDYCVVELHSLWNWPWQFPFFNPRSLVINESNLFSRVVSSPTSYPTCEGHALKRFSQTLQVRTRWAHVCRKPCCVGGDTSVLARTSPGFSLTWINAYYLSRREQVSRLEEKEIFQLVSDRVLQGVTGVHHLCWVFPHSCVSETPSRCTFIGIHLVLKYLWASQENQRLTSDGGQESLVASTSGLEPRSMWEETQPAQSFLMALGAENDFCFLDWPEKQSKE